MRYGHAQKTARVTLRSVRFSPARAMCTLHAIEPADWDFESEGKRRASFCGACFVTRNALEEWALGTGVLVREVAKEAPNSAPKSMAMAFVGAGRRALPDQLTEGGR